MFMELTKGQRLLANITQAWREIDPAGLEERARLAYEIEAIATLAGLNELFVAALDRTDALNLTSFVLRRVLLRSFGFTWRHDLDEGTNAAGLTARVLEAYLSCEPTEEYELDAAS